MSYRDWHVGMRVVARDDAPKRDQATRAAASRAGIVSPKRGQVYTIRDITIGHLSDGDVVCLRFKEIRNSYRHAVFDGGEFAFAARNFRPVQSRKTDISIFKVMLNRQPAIEGARE